VAGSIIIFVSMIGSGMNTAAVTWFILQATHSEMSLSALVVLQTMPALLMLPFTGVIIDREDRRRLIILLDALRCAVIFTVAVLAIRNQVRSGIPMPWEYSSRPASGCSGRRSPPTARLS
jgi:hypothetical protein